ncbi:MAG TPA: DNA methylase [Bacillota bacterium]|nr:DNA methylase [Bacillota bacterium]
MIEKNFNIPFIADLALHEKQIQQNYRPIIAIHKWFARRPGTLFRGLLLSEFVGGSLKDNFYKAHNLKGIKVADPFMGGGTPLIEANRLGCDVVGYDINPMAYWIVSQEIEHLDLKAYREAATTLQSYLEKEIGTFYKTKCRKCGSPNAHVKYFIWVKTRKCDGCGGIFDLFPGYLLAANSRHPRNVVICSACGELNEVDDRKKPGICQACGSGLKLNGPAKRNRCQCPYCSKVNTYPNTSNGAPQHRMVAIEYHCPACKPNQRGRFFKKPDQEDLAKYEKAFETWRRLCPSFVPDDEIPPGDETDRLHRWGYRRYREMFNHRQLLGLELSCRFIARHKDSKIRNALATNLSDLLRYQNMLCRYDTMALKSLDMFSVHGFPVGLIQCESNLLGIPNSDKGTNVGSGGWSNIILKYERAKAYCENPFEIRRQSGRRIQVAIKGEWIGEHRNTSVMSERRGVELHCCSSTFSDLPPASLDAVLTDPPYFASVQYAELMDFCYVWLRRLAIDNSGVFKKHSTRDENELTGNITMERGLLHFAEGLSAIFVKMARALKQGAPLVFTYHHNTIEAYLPVAVAILDAGLTCSASIPCPGEMGASIHINGTGSSVIDTVFVCRSTGSVPRHIIVSTPQEIAGLLLEDIKLIRTGNIRLIRGDIRCIAYGHLVRLAVWNLRKSWNIDLSTEEKMKVVARTIEKLGGWTGIEKHLPDDLLSASACRTSLAREQQEYYGGEDDDEISF